MAEHIDDTQLDAIASQVRSRPPLEDGRVDALLQLARRDPHSAAGQELVEHHLDVALAAALRRRAHGVDLSDLYQEAAIAVVVAIEEYAAHGDGRPGPLHAYVERVVARHLDDAVSAEEDRRRQDEAFARDAELLSAAETVLRRDLRRPATPEELAEVLGWPLERVQLLHGMVDTAGALHDTELVDYLDDVDDDVE